MRKGKTVPELCATLSKVLADEAPYVGSRRSVRAACISKDNVQLLTEVLGMAL